MSRPRLDPATRDGQIDSLLLQLRRTLENGRKTPYEQGLLPLVSKVIHVREVARRDQRAMDWRYGDDVEGFDRTPVVFVTRDSDHGVPVKLTIAAIDEKETRLDGAHAVDVLEDGAKLTSIYERARAAEDAADFTRDIIDEADVIE